MRVIERETGKPYPRRKPVDWAFVRSTLAWRQADKKIRDAGFEKVSAFSSLPWESPCLTHEIVDVAVHPDRMTLYVKLIAKSDIIRAIQKGAE